MTRHSSAAVLIPAAYHRPSLHCLPMADTSAIFARDRALVGMVHVDALPGTPGSSGQSVIDIAVRSANEAQELVEAGFDAIIIENMHDTPYLLREVGPEITAAMTNISIHVKRAIGGVPLGVQILAGANHAALAVAFAAGAQFIRAEGFVFSSIADEGLIADADAGPLLRYRRQIGAEHIKVLADIKKKHSSHAITGDVDLAQTAQAAAFFGADGLVVTGTATGSATDIDDIRSASQATDLPILVGSGATPETMADLFAHANAIIVGSWYKRDGHWANPPDPERVARLVDAAEAARA